MTGKASEPAAGFQNDSGLPKDRLTSAGRLLMRQTACARRFQLL